MRLLLDTHTFLWFIEGNPQLSFTAKTLVEDITNQVFISAASLWEIAIKVSIGKLSLAQPFEVLIPQQLAINSFDLLGISIDHTILISKLAFYHRDPFDRLLVAQAVVEQIPIVSIDSVFDSYSVSRLW